MSHRDKVLAKQILQVLSQTLYYEMSNPKLACVTITDVQVSADLQYADVQVTTGGEEPGPVLVSLEHCKGALKRSISAKIKLRRIPELRFHVDTSAEDVARIEDILQGLHIPPAEEDEEPHES